MQRSRLAFLSCLVFLACGGSTSSDPTSNSETQSTLPADSFTRCTEATDALCERGASCRDDGTTMIRYGTAVTEQHLTVDDCKRYYAFICSDPPKADSYDGSACAEALRSATCGGEGDERGAEFPTSACPNALH